MGQVEAQGLGTPVLAVATTGQPVFVATADVNADGIPDLIYIEAGATATASTTHVLLGDGKGGFKESAAIATAGTSVAIGSLMGTGRVDVGWLTVNSASGAVTQAWHIAPGKGDGTFSTTISHPFSGLTPPPVPTVFGYLKAGNIKGQTNAIPEIVAVDVPNATLYAFPIEPTGVFSQQTVLPKGAGPVTLADLNGDAVDDIAVDGLTAFQSQVYLGTDAQTTGGAFDEIDGTFSSGTSGVYSLLFQDVNGDGKPDLIVEGASGRIDVFAGNGDGTFGTSSIGGTTSADSSAGDGGTLIAAADLNGDGILDLLTYTPLGVSVELGSKSGNYTLYGVYTAGPGTHSQFATADFNGDGNLDVALDAPGGIVILDGKATPPASPGIVSAMLEPSAFEATYSLIATMQAGITDGSVSFTVDGTPAGSATVVNGVATLPVAAVVPNTGPTPLLPGSHALGGTYFATQSALGVLLTPGTHVVNKAPETPVLTPSTLPVVYFGGPVNGTVAFPVQDNRYGATGSWTLTDNGYTPPVCVDIPVTYQPGCPYGYPELLNAGPHSFVITYNGDAVNAVGASAPQLYTVLPDPTAVTLASLTNPAAAGQSVTFQATVSTVSPGVVTETPQGLVTFMDGTTVLASEAVDTNGQAGYSTSSLSLGLHAITASYAPLPISDPSQPTFVYDWTTSTSGVLNQVIQPPPNNAASAVVLTSSLNPSAFGQSVTFTAAVSVPGPFPNLIQSGMVSFLDGTKVIGTGTINQLGLATFSTSMLAVGSHPITASYPGGTSGAVTILPGVSPVLTQVVTTAIPMAPPGFVLTVTPNPGKIPAGMTGIFLVTVRAVSGFSEPVTLNCGKVPEESKCTFVEPIIPAGGGSTTLQLATTAPHSCGSTTAYDGSPVASCTVPQRGFSGKTVAGVALGGLLVWLPLRRKRFGRLLAALVMMVGIVSLNGCGNCTDLGTEPGNYHFTVTGMAPGFTVTTGGALTQSVVVKVTIENP